VAIALTAFASACGHSDPIVVEGNIIPIPSGDSGRYLVTLNYGRAAKHNASLAPVVYQDTDRHFVLRARFADTDHAPPLFLSAGAYLDEVYPAPNCGFVDLRPLRLVDGRWVEIATGAPLEINLRLRAGGDCP
jgi:hypothetical protein